MHFDDALKYLERNKPARAGKLIWAAMYEAVSKQLPQSATFKEGYFGCPRCKKVIGYISNNKKICNKYCPHCGQYTGGTEFYEKVNGRA